MRISTSWNNQLGLNAMLDQQSKLSETQLKLSSGKKYLSPSENAVAATSLIDLNHNIKENQQYQVNIGAARQRLDLEESALDNAGSVLHRIRELTVQGLNDSNTATNRKQIAMEIDELNKQLLSIANTKNANGEYIFSGYKTDQAAFTDTPAYAYQGDANQRSIAIGPSRQVTDGDPGDSVFGSIQVAPLTAGSISNVFQAVAQISADLKANTPNKGSLNDMDAALVRFDTIRASAGARLNALDDQENLNADYILDNKSTASDIGDLDYAEALSKFNLQQISLQAAQQAFTKVQNLSLFNYIS
ncbi:flagellar hook-associated protein FlgL [Methylomonas fluvii]|uniref:Flagellar hook-associated protein FlgL n=1 Tax=Methylomonas fluvii TaxID=1854564 RepID=A0ABR9DC00_9GAMM|nr:flagellar hook-associated protein FlgL [Methylomonas fluvii]MBD9360475.1 flagellar hook-associated protein FlgL [Methylomonas fluvii]CAD6873294.1 Flagellar hook-associated protein FlgL [Methylomonas fluvii]